MAFTQSDLDKINSAITSGELEVEFDDHRVKYRSISELKAAKQMIEDEINSASDQRRPRAFVSRFNRNL